MQVDKKLPTKELSSAEQYENSWMVEMFCIPCWRASSSGPQTASVEQDVDIGSLALAVSNKQALRAKRRLSATELEESSRA